MADLIRNELFHYVEPRHQKMLINRIWELGTAVYQHHSFIWNIKRQMEKSPIADIKPVGILCSDIISTYCLYREHDKTSCYPTIYRVDRIVSYKISKETFHVPTRIGLKKVNFGKGFPSCLVESCIKPVLLTTGRILMPYWIACLQPPQ